MFDFLFLFGYKRLSLRVLFYANETGYIEPEGMTSGGLIE
jgi:hypothetical protein